MIYNTNGNKYENNYLWESTKNQPYDYFKHGLLNKILSNKIYNTSNDVLKMILHYYETSLIFLMKYVDELKNFKNIYWKNR